MEKVLNTFITGGGKVEKVADTFPSIGDKVALLTFVITYAEPYLALRTCFLKNIIDL